MERLQEKFRELRDYLTKMSPLEAAFMVLVLVTVPIDILSVYLGWVNPAEVEALKNYVKQTPIKELLYYTVIFVPLQEEVVYRGLGRIFIFFVPPDNYPRKLLAWIMVLGPTYYWAVVATGGHAIPLDALIAGIMFGWVLIETRSLESAIALHCLYNLVGLIGALIKYRLL